MEVHVTCNESSQSCVYLYEYVVAGWAFWVVVNEVWAQKRIERMLGRAVASCHPDRFRMVHIPFSFAVFPVLFCPAQIPIPP
jgi:hypothetical protein